MHLVYPAIFGIANVFDFSWDDRNIWEKLETTVMQNLGGGGGGGGGGVNKRGIMVYVKMVN